MSRRVLALAATLLLAAPAGFAQSRRGRPGQAAVEPGRGPDQRAVPVQLQRRLSATEAGNQSYVNIQPVIPISISANWNLISRTILPVVSQDDIVPGSGSQFGLGATTQSFFFSPKAPTGAGLIWGVGPAFLIPTATDGIAPQPVGRRHHRRGAEADAAPGRSARSPTTSGRSTGDSRLRRLSPTFLQPFLSYTTPKATSFTLNTESTYDWENKEWSVPINLAASAQMVKIGGQPVQFGLGARYWAQSPEDGPDGWGARAVVTLLFPK